MLKFAHTEFKAGAQSVVLDTEPADSGGVSGERPHSLLGCRSSVQMRGGGTEARALHSSGMWLLFW